MGEVYRARDTKPNADVAIKVLSGSFAEDSPRLARFRREAQVLGGGIAPLVLDRHPEYRAAKILERIVAPEQVIMFRVPWMDDQSEVRIHRGFRIRMNSAIGPYKGSLRFHPSVNLGILKSAATLPWTRRRG